MMKLATCAVLFVMTASATWTGYRAVTARADGPESTSHSQASADPLASEAAYRHRNNLPNHWRGYVLQPRSF